MKLVQEDLLPVAEREKMFAVIRMRSYTRKDLRCSSIQLAHDGDLMAPLFQIALVDASGVYPDELGYTRFCSEPLLHDIFAILSNDHGLPIYGDGDCLSRVTPGV